MTKYIAKHEGKIAGKRKTDRTYSHAVVVLPDINKARKAAYNFTPSELDRKNYNFYLSETTSEKSNWRSAASHAEYIADCHAKTANGYDGYVAMLRAEAIANFEKLVGQNYFSPTVVTWCGRLDLARKEAAQRAGRYAGIWIVPAEVA